MSENEDLLNLMKEIVAIADDYSQLSSLESKVEEFIYKWTNVEDVTGNRGSFDAKKLAAMEELRGVGFEDSTGSSNPTNNQAPLLNAAWSIFVNDVTLKVATQAIFKDIFSYTKTITIPESTEVVTSPAIDPNTGEILLDEQTGEVLTVSETITIPAYETVATFSPVYDFASDSIDFNGISASEVFLNVSAKLESLVKEVSTASDAEVAGKINNIYAINNKNNKVNFLNQIKEVLNVIANQNLITGLNSLSVRDNIEQISATYLGEGSEALSALGLNLAYDSLVVNSSSISLSDEIFAIANDNFFKPVLERNCTLF